MYDLWFTLGTAVMNPGLLDAITAAGPIFTPVSKRQIIETDGGGTVTFTSTNIKTAGLLDKGQTPVIRAAIRTFLQINPAAPPISIYTAGRLSQLMVVAGIQFKTVMQNANTAYVSASQGYTGAYPPAFPALLGLCLLDSAAVTFIGKPADPNLISLMGEFGINPDPNSPERAIITNYVQHLAFKKAAAILMTGDSTPWQDICGDQYFFWDPQNERAVL